MLRLPPPLAPLPLVTMSMLVATAAAAAMAAKDLPPLSQELAGWAARWPAAPEAAAAEPLWPDAEKAASAPDLPSAATAGWPPARVVATAAAPVLCEHGG